MPRTDPEFSIVVPVYKGAPTLEELHARLDGVFSKLGSWELIFVNDCSPDNSWEVVKKIAARDKRVTAIALTNNFGQHAATMCGLAHSSGRYVITMDQDLQEPPEELVKLVDKIKTGDYSVVYAQYPKRKYPWYRNFASRSVNGVLSRITGSGYTVTTCRIIERSLVEKLIGFKQHNIMLDVLIKDAVTSRNVGHVDISHQPSRIGSSYSFKKLVRYALNMVFSYTLWPLRLAIILGLVFSTASFALGLYYVYYYFTHGVSVSGWTSLFLSITFMSGVVLFVLGLIGEYVGRIFLNVNQKPQYLVKEVVNG